MAKTTILLLIIAIVGVSAKVFDAPSKVLTEKATRKRQWWQNANYYQIYPRSFYDSDGDGVGDLRGIMQKAQYLKDLGMEGVWLSPIMKSPMVDFGYDISDFRDIDETFGTMQDFDNLLAEFNRLGLKMILDFVPNHTSDKHEWFLKSVERDPEYENFYIWHDGLPNPAGGQNLPPNNWVSNFRFSAWEWNEKRQQYYYHAFAVQQPDLNYREPKVVAAMKDILRFWLDKGVAGFRCDAVYHLFEVAPDSEGNFPDEPPSGKCDDPESFCYLNHIYVTDQDETYKMIYEWRQVLDEYKNWPRMMMTEAYTSLANIMRYYGDGFGILGSQIPFNFELLTKINANSDAGDIKSIVEGYLDHIPANNSGNWVLGNHDQKRIASRLGESRIDLYNILLQMLPGHAITYQGEEIGMTDGEISWEDTKDPLACFTNRTYYNEVSRDPARTPFQWNSDKNAGFSQASSTWLPMAKNYEAVNVEKESAAENSHLKIFKKLVELKKNEVLRWGDYKSALINDQVYAFRRRLGNETYIIALNFGKTSTTIDLKKNFPSLKGNLKLVVASLESGMKDGATLDSSKVTISAESGFVAYSKGTKMAISVFLIIFCLFKFF
ncbi:maltase A1-like [Culicoides brevitarsis]|uniref:maltase A1-like n=1 Tax=Culicoides brevitarsis TaxID=469753 RepID=UPI00307B3C4B